MNRFAVWCLCLIVCVVNGEVEPASCAGSSCEGIDSTVLLQSDVGVAAATDAEDDDDSVGDDVPGGADSNVDCSSLTTGTACKSSGCSWSGAFVGEKKADGTEVAGYICADDEEVEEEVHDKLMNGTGTIIGMLEDDDESSIADAGTEERWCRRRRRGRRGGGCPYCRRRRAPPAPVTVKIEANGCPTGLSPSAGQESKGVCPGEGQCCAAGWSASCAEACAKTRCTSTGGTWIKVNLQNNPYTCEMPKARKYCDDPKGDNAGFDCLCATGTGFCGTALTWTGSYDVAKAKCDGNAECNYLHDWKADGQNWRACRKITSPGDGKAAIKRLCSLTPVTDFDRIDTDKSGIIDRAEWKKAIDAGTISPASGGGGAAPAPAPAPPLATSPLFNSLDKNHNKKLSADEFKNGVAAGKIIVPA